MSGTVGHFPLGVMIWPELIDKITKSKVKFSSNSNEKILFIRKYNLLNFGQKSKMSSDIGIVHNCVKIFWKRKSPITKFRKIYNKKIWKKNSKIYEIFFVIKFCIFRPRFTPLAKSNRQSNNNEQAPSRKYWDDIIKPIFLRHFFLNTNKNFFVEKSIN